ncbi:TPA: toxin [Clostridium botulinum]|uniref:toxin n=1 Tax=Clostridium TaxID=1485 RepID=UPI000B1544A7|nr:MULTISPECIES: toxin [Clostridium]HBJ2612245.1 toxin [Clostridium botulinum]
MRKIGLKRQFCFEDSKVFMDGSFFLEKIQKQYHPKYDYFKVKFCEGNLYIRDKNKNKLAQFDLKDIESVIAFKKEYLEENELKNIESNSFININNKWARNKYGLYVVNVDITKKLEKDYLLKAILNEKLKFLFLGNEDKLLKIKN